MEAQDLLCKDKLLGGLIKGKSDPYGVIKVGTYIYKSKVIQENLNPKWNEVYEVRGWILESRHNLMEFICVCIYNSSEEMELNCHITCCWNLISS